MLLEPSFGKKQMNILANPIEVVKAPSWKIQLEWLAADYHTKEIIKAMFQVAIDLPWSFMKARRQLFCFGGWDKRTACKSGQMYQSTVKSGHHTVTHIPAISCLWEDSHRLGIDRVIGVVSKPIDQKIKKKTHVLKDRWWSHWNAWEKQIFTFMINLKQRV